MKKALISYSVIVFLMLGGLIAALTAAGHVASLVLPHNGPVYSAAAHWGVVFIVIVLFNGLANFCLEKFEISIPASSARLEAVGPVHDRIRAEQRKKKWLIRALIIALCIIITAFFINAQMEQNRQRDLLVELVKANYPACNRYEVLYDTSSLGIICPEIERRFIAYNSGAVYDVTQLYAEANPNYTADEVKLYVDMKLFVGRDELPCLGRCMHRTSGEDIQKMTQRLKRLSDGS